MRITASSVCIVVEGVEGKKRGRSVRMRGPSSVGCVGCVGGGRRWGWEGLVGGEGG